MAHKEQWENIAGLLKKVTTHCYHQISHTNQDSEAAIGNREIDKFIGQVKLPELTELFQKLHDDLNHLSVNGIKVEVFKYGAFITEKLKNNVECEESL